MDPAENTNKTTEINNTEDASDSEFYDANDLVEIVENKFNKINLEESEKLEKVDTDDDFQSFPPRSETLINELEEKVKEMEKEDETESEKEKEDSSGEEYESDKDQFIPLHEKLNREMKNKKKNEQAKHEAESLNEISDTEVIKDDPYFIDEALLKEEQANLTDMEKEEKLKEAQESKQSGNSLFKEENYIEALDLYTKAIRTCPISYEKDRSIFYSNRSLCFFKMKELEKCVADCTKSIELDPTFNKPLLRRAECFESLDKLDEALVDYKKMMDLERANFTYKQKCYELEEKIKERNEKMKNEMMGKLKDLGNMFLKPFGMSTENFQFVQDPNSGSYSVNFKK